ncbi:glycosyltransferase [Nocardiopsis sp. N85]|uniref:glycosyltransferase n=1 Tax=Nocardiopsis sp. N85 TaxID=3029400 RepID=UPI00237F93E3|nr:glycosyltransferase [Nocardiopsis sp. N85]MDE3722620.1 glycosyltransferase [Nocardiopsis sp. N85]
MHALLLTHGTRGDVQPFLALALALSAAGHTATVAGPESYAPLADAFGVPYHPVDDGPNALMDDPAMAGVGETGLHGLRGAVHTVTLLREITPRLRPVYTDMAATVDLGADIVVHIPGMPGAHIAERLGVPAVPVALQPSWVPTGAFPAPGVPWPRWVPARFDRLSYRLAETALRGQRKVADDLRRDLGLTPRPGAHDPLVRPDGTPATVIHAFSRHLVPADTGYPSWVRTTGFWSAPEDGAWDPPKALEGFLSAGDPPVFIGFGSLPDPDPDATGRMVAAAVRRAGVRAVLASGRGGVTTVDGEDVLVIDQAPHGSLFPRCSAVVHHAGAGTTGAALASGRPQVVCPFWGDQPFWAGRVHVAGAAPAPLNGRRLTEDALAGALTQVLTGGEIAACAADLGERVRAEGGTAEAVRILEEVLASEGVG